MGKHKEALKHRGSVRSKRGTGPYIFTVFNRPTCNGCRSPFAIGFIMSKGDIVDGIVNHALDPGVEFVDENGAIWVVAEFADTGLPLCLWMLDPEGGISGTALVPRVGHNICNLTPTQVSI